MLKKEFAIPGLYEQYIPNILYLRALQLHPEYFIDDLKINAIYGNFQFCTWDGGRIFVDSKTHATKEQIEVLKYIYNTRFQIPMRFVFTNKLLEENDLHDRFNNLILQICDSPENEIVVNSSLLENYLRENYPNYNLISSTTKCLNNQSEALAELDKNYKYICLDYNLNKNKKFLESIPEEIKPKVELLINPICGPACSNRAHHYTLNSLFALNYGKRFTLTNCAITKGDFYPMHNSVFINPEEIDNYFNQSLNHYKIEGRTFPAEDIIINLVRYTVKPEYSAYILAFLLNNTKRFAQRPLEASEVMI